MTLLGGISAGLGEFVLQLLCFAPSSVHGKRNTRRLHIVSRHDEAMKQPGHRHLKSHRTVCQVIPVAGHILLTNGHSTRISQKLDTVSPDPSLLLLVATDGLRKLEQRCHEAQI